MGFGAMKGLGIGLQQVAQDMGERLREERKQQYQETLWQREKTYREGLLKQENAREDSLRPVRQELVNDNGKAFQIAYNAKGDEISRVEAKPEKPGRLSDNYIKLKDAEGNEALFTQDESGRLVPAMGGNSTGMDPHEYAERKALYVKRRHKEVDKNNLLGFRGSDTEDYKLYGGSKAKATIAFEQEFDDMMAGKNAAGQSNNGSQQPASGKPSPQPRSSAQQQPETSAQPKSYEQAESMLMDQAKKKGFSLSKEQAQKIITDKFPNLSKQKSGKGLLSKSAQPKDEPPKYGNTFVDALFPSGVQDAAKKFALFVSTIPGGANAEAAFRKKTKQNASSNPEAYMEFVAENYPELYEKFTRLDMN